MPRLRYLLVLLVALTLGSAAHAALRTERIDYRDGEVELQGYLAWDDAITGKRPGILVAHEWWGLGDYVRQRTEMLAQLGYVAFALDMYGKGKVTEHGADAKAWMNQITANQAAWVQRAQRGLEILRRNANVDPARLGAVGYCFGGGTVLQLAYAGADLKGVASFHGPLPPPNQQQLTQIKASLFAATGADDAFVPPERVQQFEAALKQRQLDWLVTTYANARHGFTNPGADKYGVDNIRYDAQADQRSWAAMQSFFREVFARK